MGDKIILGRVLPMLRELRRRRRHSFFKYKPDNHPKRNQLSFHRSTASCRLVFGGNQSGKSFSIAYEIAWWLTECHPFLVTPKAPKIYCISATYRTMQEGLWRHLKNILPEWLIEMQGPRVAGWQIPSYVRMRTGAEIYFISGEGRESARKTIQAAAIDLAVVDEEVDGILHGELISRRLTTGGREIVGATLKRSEPWCLELEDRAEGGDPEVHLTRLSTYRAMEAGHVKEKVVRELEACLSEDDRQVWLEGKSRRHEGLVYNNFDGKKHVIEPFKPPANWTRYMSIDPGWRTCAVLWIAVAPDGKYVIYRELYYHGTKYQDLANAIYEAEGWKWDPEYRVWVCTKDSEEIKIRWIDPSAFGTHEGGQPRIGNLLTEKPYRIITCPAPNDVMRGIEQCRLALDPDIDGVPKCRVFKGCVNFIKEIRNYRWEKDDRAESRKEAPDRPVKRRDHALDAWRYAELGHLIWYPKPDPMLGREPGLPPSIKASPVMEGIVADHWKELRKKQLGRPTCVQHPGGIGSEY